MKKLSILILALVAMTLSGCYSHRVIGYLQEPTKCNKLPVYDSVPYEPYKLRVNDEIIYRLITMDETMSKMLGANTMSYSSQYANSYRIHQDGTVDMPFLKPIKIAGLTEAQAQDTLKAAFKEIIPDADVKVAMYNKYFSVIGDANAGQFYVYKEKMNIFQALAMTGDVMNSGRRSSSSTCERIVSSTRNTITSIPTTSSTWRERKTASIKCRTTPVLSG